MVFDWPLLQQFYDGLDAKQQQIRNLLNRPLTLTEKILYAHLSDDIPVKDYARDADYVTFAPDRAAMQDATAQMALLQFMNAGMERTAVPATVHCDHLVPAQVNAKTDLEKAKESNREVYDFLQSVSDKYGIGFWKPGAGIIHQVILENYAFPGGMMVGTDSHTPNAGGLGMVAIGVGGADAVDVMAAIPWELRMPKIIGVKLTGKLNGWASPKDVILKLAGILTVKGGTNAIIEYFGDGAASISATGKATICNMGAEVGATCSLFPYDGKMARFLAATGRNELVKLADANRMHLQADPEVTDDPGKYYDRVIEIDLNTLEPYINGPFTPDAAHPLSTFAKAVKDMDYPQKMEVGLIGSCTNSSYEDMTRAASIARQALEKGVKARAGFIVTPGSEQVRYTAERDGLLQTFEAIGGVTMANACGPCIGQWKRQTDDPARRNSIITSFNRNFAKRNDGNPNTCAFVASPDIVTALTIAGDLTFNPTTDFLVNEQGEKVRLDPPRGMELPLSGFAVDDPGYIAPSENGAAVVVRIDPHSERLQELQPFAPWDGKDFKDLRLLVKVSGKCTTDHISMAGPWLRYRGRLERISENMLMGAVNAFNGKTDHVLDNSKPGTRNIYGRVSEVAAGYKRQGIGSIVVAGENYGEGSSREHAAMEPRFLNVKAILAKSFARIHETNLKKQGMLALTFADKADYDLIREDDTIDILGLETFAPGKALAIALHHADGTHEEFQALHTCNRLQIEWFKAGSALNRLNHQVEP
ncbi:MAG: aconitate hydratase [Bacteroidales bacterium]|nr:aconitate hydratase [Bacteroidales bacterium]